MEWLKPSLMETVERLAREGRKHLLVIPIAFVTDHIETLHEINIEVRKHAIAHGVRQFELMPALNDHPKFIQCLAELVQSQPHIGYTTENMQCTLDARTRIGQCRRCVPGRTFKLQTINQQNDEE